MSSEYLMAALSAAGHFPQLRTVAPWSDSPVIETAHSRHRDGRLLAPLLRTFRDRKERWVLTVFGKSYYHVPNEDDVPAAAIEILRAMGNCMDFSPAVVKKYNLIELNCSEFETDDE